MSRDPEDEAHTSFVRMDGADDGNGEEPVVSRAAFQLHTFVIVNSVRDGRTHCYGDRAVA